MRRFILSLVLIFLAGVGWWVQQASADTATPSETYSAILGRKPTKTPTSELTLTATADDPDDPDDPDTPTPFPIDTEVATETPVSPTPVFTADTVTPTQTPAAATATRTPPRGASRTATPTVTPRATIERTSSPVAASPSVSEGQPSDTVTLRQNVNRPDQGRNCRIDLRLERSQHVRIRVFSRDGRELITLADQEAGAGVFETQWSGRNSRGEIVASGIYLVWIQTNDFEARHKLIVVR